MGFVVRPGLRALLLSFLVVGSAATSVSAESGIASEDIVFAKLRRPNLPIPTDGALLIVSGNFELPIIEVRGPDGALIEGSLREVGLDSNPLYSWKSTATLTAGTHEVTIRHSDGTDHEDVVSVEVVAPFANELPALRTEPSAIWQAFPQERACCTIPNTMEGNVCFPTLQEAIIRVQPGFSSPSSQAVLNQWLFRVDPAPGSSGANPNPIYRPLEHPSHEVAFREASDAYCIEVHVRNIATLEDAVYSELDSCTSHDNREVGSNIPIEIDPSIFTIENRCYEPPAEYKDAWCEVNESACGTGEPSECELYEYVCEGARLPAAWETVFSREGGTEEPLDAASDAGSDASEMPPDPIDASFGPSAHQDGCTVTRPHARSSAIASLGAALALLMLTRRRIRLTRGRLAPRRR
jgi:hypothetical protein